MGFDFSFQIGGALINKDGKTKYFVLKKKTHTLWYVKTAYETTHSQTLSIQLTSN
jgi:hypothetical protein